MFPFFLVVTASSVVNIMQSVRYSDTRHELYGTLYVGNRHTPSPCLFTFDCHASESKLPMWVLQSSTSWTPHNATFVTEYVYLDHQPYVQAPLLASIDTACQCPMCNFSEFTVVFNFYNTSILNFGPISDAIKVHMNVYKRAPLVDANAFQPDGFRLITSRAAGLTSTGLETWSLALWSHQLKSTADCGPWIVSSDPPLVFDVGCDDTTVYDNTLAGAIFSMHQLKMGMYYHTNSSVLELYQANPYDIDIWRQWSTLIMLSVFIAMWLGWCHNLFSDIAHDLVYFKRLVAPGSMFSHAQDTASGLPKTHIIWYTLTQTYLVLNVSLALFVMSVNMWAVYKKSHILYDMAAIELIGFDLTILYTIGYGYGVTSVLCTSVLLLLAYGNLMYTASLEKAPLPFLSWNIKWIARLEAYQRVLLFVVVCGTVISMTWIMWYRTFFDFYGATFAALGTALVCFYFSSSSNIQRTLAIRFSKWNLENDATLLVCLRCAIEVLQLSAFNNAVPFNFEDALAIQFHSCMVMTICIMMTYTAARDTVYVYALSQTWRPVLGISLLSAFVISYAFLFGISSVYVYSGGLVNLRRAAFWVSLEATIAVYALSFAWTVNDVRAILAKTRAQVTMDKGPHGSSVSYT